MGLVTRIHRKVLVSLFFGLMLCSAGCDPERLKKCEWYLVPELEHKNLVDEGYVPLCARNYQTKKQRCFLQAKLPFAEKVYGTSFRFSDMELTEGKLPRKVQSIKPCKADPDEG